MSKKITGLSKNENGSIKSVYVEGEGCWAKQSIIDRINRKEIFEVNGTNVNVVDDKYLRTDKNQTKSDNLGELDIKCS